MQNNKSMVYWMLGDYYNAQRINYELMNVIKPHPESYPEAITIVLSNNLMFNGYTGFEKNNIKSTKSLLINKKISYDAITNYPLKSNLFLFKKVGELNDSEDDNDPLFEELDAFFSKNKNVNGYFQFLRGAIIKFSRQGNREKEIIYLNKVIDYVREINIGTLSIENFIAIQARIKLAEYSNNFFEILYLIFDYPHKHYTFKHFEV